MFFRGSMSEVFNIVIVAQSGRLEYEALVFAASLRAKSPKFKGRLLVCEPQPGPKWNSDPRMGSEVREALGSMGAEILPFTSEHFGQDYPNGNKIECLKVVPTDRPFVFFDTDTLVLDDIRKVPFDFDRPTASMRRESTWPQIELYGPGYHATWESLYRQFGLEIDSALDKSWPEEFWRRYPYFNAGFFYHRDAAAFGARYLEIALGIRDNRPAELVCQEIWPWLDQIALPLVLHSFGGGFGALEEGWLDGRTTCHYRVLPLLYARESEAVINVIEEITAPNKIKKILKNYEPIKRMVYQGRGKKVRALFDQNDMPRKEQGIRNRIKKEGFWMR